MLGAYLVEHNLLGCKMTKFTFSAERDFLPAARKRIIMLLAFVTVPLFLPFVVFNFLRGNIILSSLFLVLALGLLVNGYSLYRNRDMPVPAAFLQHLLSVALVYIMSVRGVSALFWCYPAVFSTFFINKRYSARLHLSMQIITFSVAAYYFVPTPLAVRFAFSLVMVSVWSDILIGILINFQTRLVKLTIRDPLTGAYNRRCLIDSLESAIAVFKREEQHMTLVAFDIDNFKHVNDTFGHQIGDDVLVGIVKTVSDRQRQVDSIFRLGGEEFVVLLHNTTLQSALIFADDVRVRIARAPLIDNHPVTVSMGVAEYRENEHLDDWLKRADHNMYRAKEDGRNCIYADNQRVGQPHDSSSSQGAIPIQFATSH